MLNNQYKQCQQKYNYLQYLWNNRYTLFSKSTIQIKKLLIFGFIRKIEESCINNTVTPVSLIKIVYLYYNSSIKLFINLENEQFKIFNMDNSRKNESYLIPNAL